MYGEAVLRLVGVLRSGAAGYLGDVDEASSHGGKSGVVIESECQLSVRGLPYKDGDH